MKWIDKIPRWAQAPIVIIAIGIGVLIWQSLPDSVPESDLTPATPAPTTAPLTTVVPATPIIGDADGGCSKEQKRACKNMLCATDACAACCFDPEVGVEGGNVHDLLNAAAASLQDTAALVTELSITDTQRAKIEASVTLAKTNVAQADMSAAADDPAKAIGELAEAGSSIDTVHDEIQSGIDTGHIAAAAGQPILDLLAQAKLDVAKAVNALEQAHEVGSTGDAPHTSTANLQAAYDNIFQAHEGMSNVLKHNLEGSTCSQRCQEAIASAGTKVVTAHGELQDDILLLHTWDNNQTVDHAFASALYWWNRVEQFLDAEDGHRAIYQVGILRDMLLGQLHNRSTEVGATGTENVCSPEESCHNLRLGCKLGSSTDCAECWEKKCGDCGPFKVGADGAEATPPASIAQAQALVEEAHEGIGNVWHNDIHSGQPDCGADCIAAINDAAYKTRQARDMLGPDILSLRTWDHNQTIGHAFWAALYWIEQVNEGETDSGDAAPHALFQLGILRDVLKAS